MGDYGQTVMVLAGRIYEKIPKHPEIMDMDEEWIFTLHKIPGLEMDDLRPSLMQVRYALATARHRYRDQYPL